MRASCAICSDRTILCSDASHRALSGPFVCTGFVLTYTEMKNTANVKVFQDILINLKVTAAKHTSVIKKHIVSDSYDMGVYVR